MSDWLPPPWEPKDGPIEWVYSDSDKPLGSRCLWACRWRIPGGYLMPEKIAPVAKLTEEQAFYELRDVSSYDSVVPDLKEKVVFILADVNSPEDLDLEAARRLIGAVGAARKLS